jgi:hypothetical protein
LDLKLRFAEKVRLHTGMPGTMRKIAVTELAKDGGRALMPTGWGDYRRNRKGKISNTDNTDHTDLHGSKKDQDATIFDL